MVFVLEHLDKYEPDLTLYSASKGGEVVRRCPAGGDDGGGEGEVEIIGTVYSATGGKVGAR